MKGYFLVVDVLGFSEIVKNLEGEELKRRMDEWIEIAEGLCNKYSFHKHQMISDTLFVAVDGTEADLEKMVDFCSELLSFCTSKSILLRGAISDDEYTWTEDLVYGRAVIAAHSHEMNQDWIGISCVSGQSIPSKLYGKLVCYGVPTKSGPQQIGAAVRWNVPIIHELAALATRGGLTTRGQRLTYPWVKKLENTALFGMYIRTTDAIGWGFEEFHGFSPLQVMEVLFDRIAIEEIKKYPKRYAEMFTRVDR